MKYYHFDRDLNVLALKMALKKDEEVVCTNATVVMDKNGNLSYFDNDNLLTIIAKEDANGQKV